MGLPLNRPRSFGVAALPPVEVVSILVAQHSGYQALMEAEIARVLCRPDSLSVGGDNARDAD
jgi:hypothetical protein